MKREEFAAPQPPAAQVELMLARIEQSHAFQGSPRHRALLRHLVDRTLADEVTALKESVIAVEVFGRSASRFDPKIDSIVRVETRRLRTRLATYFGTEGREAPLRIELPVGSYVPVIGTRAEPQHAPEATRRARDLTERGEHFLRQALSRPTLEAARDRFMQALRESPGYAPAYVGLGRAWLNLATGWHDVPGPASEHAAESLQRALALDPGNAIAHALLGAIQHQFEGDWTSAQRSFKRAIELAPQLAFVHSAYGCHLMFRGNDTQAERELRLARALDPQYINTRIHMVNLRLCQGRFDDAQLEMESMADMAPGSMALAGMAGVIALRRGDADAAVGHYERARDLAPQHANVWVCLASALAASGRTQEAEALRGEVFERFDLNTTSPYTLAILESRCGRPNEAFALLERGLLERDPNMMMLATDHSLELLHGDARWPELVAAWRRPRKA